MQFVSRKGDFLCTFVTYKHDMIHELNLRVLPQEAYNEQSIIAYLQKEKGIKAQSVQVLRRSIDARQRTIYVQLTVRAFQNEQAPTPTSLPMAYQDVSRANPVIVVGAGPAGLFAALRLIELGYRPIVVERGKDVHERKKDLARIRPDQQVNPESNYSFGEGGAGAYSDGKLYTRSKKRGNSDRILNTFVQHGASPAILVDAHPHIGTDCLPRVIENIRNTIIGHGGEVHFQTKMSGILSHEGKVLGIEAIHLATGEEISLRADAVILATGHSARDVYEWLATNHWHIETKGLAVGVRLEHPSQLIDQIQYHSPQGRGQWLPPAEYSLVRQVRERGVYSFCMCPGGVVVPAASGPEQIVVNGMSPSHRGGKWSNSGMVVEIRPEDLLSEELKIHDEVLAEKVTHTPQLHMMYFQAEMEKNCWSQGNRQQTAPAQRMTDFVNGRLSSQLSPSSYAPGLIASPLHFWMPQPIATRLRDAFQTWGRQHHGFLTNDATVIGVETRTSSPVRILRDKDTLQHTQIRGLFPCGEGAGYAGGIVSAGVDGERCAEAASDYLQLSVQR